MVIRDDQVFLLFGLNTGLEFVLFNDVGRRQLVRLQTMAVGGCSIFERKSLLTRPDSRSDSDEVVLCKNVCETGYNKM